VAAPGTDAAEGDEGASPARATGWRVPSVETTESGLPDGWLELEPDQPAAIVAEPSPPESGGRGETTEFGRAEVTLRPRRRWSLRRKSQEPELSDVIEPADIDLIALGADDEDQVWTDLTLAALEEPDASDGGASMAGIDAFACSSPGAEGPWSLLADDLTEPGQDQFMESAPRGAESTALELEEEFWA
jgi:hypothetical protein